MTGTIPFEGSQKEDDYIRSVSETAVPEELTPDLKETFPYPAESSYPAMVEVMAANPDHAASEDEMQ